VGGLTFRLRSSGLHDIYSIAAAAAVNSALIISHRHHQNIAGWAVTSLLYRITVLCGCCWSVLFAVVGVIHWPFTSVRLFCLAPLGLYDLFLGVNKHGWMDGCTYKYMFILQICLFLLQHFKDHECPLCDIVP